MDTNTASVSHAPALYGRACTNCARAKSKCIAALNAGAKCERCHRLNKECQSSPAVRKRRVIKSTPATKTARLEEKLDGLVSLLQSASRSLPLGTGNIVPAAQMQLSPESLQSPYPGLGDERSNEPYKRMPNQGVAYPGADLGLHPPIPTLATPNVASTSTAHNSPMAYSPYLFESSLKEADESLKIFRTYKLKHFPFIVLPASITAQELRRERPFLWFCAMAASSKSSTQQIVLGKEIRLIVGRQLLLEGERTLDLLLGLLAYIAWAYHHHHNKPIVSSLIQLAVGLLADLGLNKPPSIDDAPHIMLNYDARGCPKPFNPATRTMEERRAAITCFSFSSTISSYFQKLDPPRWTPYLDECLRILAENKECPTDSLLACLVRLQLITEKIGQAPWHDGPAELSTSRAPASFYLKALEAQLQDFKRTIPPELQQNVTLLLHLHNTSLSIHEIALSRLPLFPNSPDSPRLDSLYACLRATKDWFDVFLAIPAGHYIGFPTAILAQMAHCIIVLYRLSTFDDADWDCALVRETLDFSAVLGRLLQRISRVGAEAGLQDDGLEENCVWGATEKRLGGIKSWWDAKVLAEVGGADERGGEEVVGELGVEFWDDSWLDIIGLRDYQF